MQEVNVGGLQNLLDACIQNRVERLVFISSISAYASSNAPTIREDAPLGGADTYGRTKAEAEALLKSCADSCGLAYSILRPCVAYGERDYNNLTPRLLRMLRRPVIPVIAGNHAHMLLVHAADIADAAILAGTRPVAVGMAYNVTGGEPTSLQELATVYMELTGHDRLLVPIPFTLLRGVLLTQWLVRNLRHRRLGRMTERYRNREHERSAFLSRHCDITKARTELGYEPKVDLREGLRRTLAWYTSQALG
jgi:nucleoside-diphosphate-sugar epimerase